MLRTRRTRVGKHGCVSFARSAAQQPLEMRQGRALLLKVVGNPEDDDLANTKMQNLLKEDYPEVVDHFKKVGADEARKKANKEARECAAPLSAPFPYIFPWGGRQVGKIGRSGV